MRLANMSVTTAMLFDGSMLASRNPSFSLPMGTLQLTVPGSMAALTMYTVKKEVLSYVTSLFMFSLVRFWNEAPEDQR